MNRVALDGIYEKVVSEVLNSVQEVHQRVFPLDVSLEVAKNNAAQRDALLQDGKSLSGEELSLLTLVEVTAVSAHVAIKTVTKDEGLEGGIREKLVDMWGRAHAARCLWLDSIATGEVAGLRHVQETAVQLVSEAVGLSRRFGQTPAQYIEFASKIDGA